MPTTRRFALEPTSARSAQYLLLLLSIGHGWALFISEVRFAAHLRDICTVFTNVYEHWTWAVSICGGAFFTHLRTICTFFTTTDVFRRCARLGTLKY